MSAQQAVWLYGSLARGDQSPRSDVDILVVGDGDPPDRIHVLYPGHYKAISQYSWTEMERMAGYGSVFLHHLQREARPLIRNQAADRRLARMLETLGPYLQAESDLLAFRATLDDISDALRGDCAPDYEMAVLGSVARHASVLACFVSGGPVFGREVAFGRLREVLGLARDPRSALMRIYEYRLAEERGIRLAHRATRDDVERGLVLIRGIVERLEGLVHGYSRAVHSTA